MKKYAAMFFLLVLSLVCYRFHRLAVESRKMSVELGLNGGRLTLCGQKPNCVSSADPRPDYFIAPFTFSDSLLGRDVVFFKLKEVLLKTPGYKLDSESKAYLHFTQTTKLFGFVDDLELHLVDESEAIEVRSASRVGTSDLGVNRKRIEGLRAHFEEFVRAK